MFFFLGILISKQIAPASLFSFQLRIKTPFRKIITNDSVIFFTELKCKGNAQITNMEETEKRHRVIRLLCFKLKYAAFLISNALYLISMTSFKLCLNFSGKCKQGCVLSTYTFWSSLSFTNSVLGWLLQLNPNFEIVLKYNYFQAILQSFQIILINMICNLKQDAPFAPIFFEVVQRIDN